MRAVRVQRRGFTLGVYDLLLEAPLRLYTKYCVGVYIPGKTFVAFSYA